MGRARAQLAGHWGQAVGFSAIFLGVMIGISLCDGVVTAGFHLLVSPSSWIVRHKVDFSPFSLFLTGAVTVGACSYALSMFDGYPSLDRFETGFRRFWASFSTYFMSNLFLLFWFCLLIVPGIIKSYSYDMIYFIIADDPSAGPIEAITRSRKLMDGHKWRLFCLHLRFLGWAILCFFTLGVGLLWFLPYMATSRAAFYRDIVRASDEASSSAM